MRAIVRKDTGESYQDYIKRVTADEDEKPAVPDDDSVCGGGPPSGSANDEPTEKAKWLPDQALKSLLSASRWNVRLAAIGSTHADP